ncbi:MAG: MerR family transcriptional regulator, partial [Candidatus Eremiobacteraeota bacterium]|nr:MerR family transcriptional regulator [Candidatus Eremiobacteraeota bacterium]
MTYSIAAVARLTDVSVETLRAWERRYALVTPRRDGRGIREYTQADVERIRLANSAARLGHPIGQIATLRNDQLQALVRTDADAEPRNAAKAAPLVQKIIKCIRSYDIVHAEELLSGAALLHQPEDLVLTVLSPLMNHVGRLWERNRLSVAQEHLVSVLVRNLIGSLARLRP